MTNLQPSVRLLLTALAAGIGAFTATLDGQPEWVQALLAGVSVFLAGVGVIPPQLGAHTTVTKRGQDGYGLVDVLVALILLLLFIWLVFALVPGHR